MLVHALERLPVDRDRIEDQPPVSLPPVGALELETVMLPRDAFFGPTEHVPAAAAVGRIAAEIVSPYPPGVPVLAPGERITADVVDYLRSGPPAGMFIPDAADPELTTLRVVAS
jgi:arginine decarboxylase